MFRSELWDRISFTRYFSRRPPSVRTLFFSSRLVLTVLCCLFLSNTDLNLSLSHPSSRYSSRVQASDRWSRAAIYVSWTVAVFFSWTTLLRHSSPSITLDRRSAPFHLRELAIQCPIYPREKVLRSYLSHIDIATNKYFCCENIDFLYVILWNTLKWKKWFYFKFGKFSIHIVWCYILILCNWIEI